MAEVVGAIHAHRIIHKDIHPGQFFHDPTTQTIKITGFGMASRLPRETPAIASPHALEGSLAYKAPEQTGRMNRLVDYRSDLYALGVMFYQMLTGILPFTTEDPMALIHSHIAKQPTPPEQLQPQVPASVSAIVMKLLAKNAEDRYQSAFGLKADLALCQQSFNAGDARSLQDFQPGQQDISQQFQISQKLYGREADIRSIFATFDQVSQGSVRLLLIAGSSGVGKTALVCETNKLLVNRGGYFMAGKFDQLQRHVPYAPFLQAFQSLIQQVLTESDPQIAQWRTQLLAALGQNAQILIDVVPDLEQIIGPQPPVSELGPTESQNRFNRLVQNFLKVFTRSQSPLVIFLDDLQWSDSASLKLLQFLLCDRGSQFLFLIGAYRDNEVKDAHPLRLTLQEIQSQQGPNRGQVIQVSLQPINCSHTQALVADTLSCRSLDLLLPLANLVYRKTNGNPFFVQIDQEMVSARKWLRAWHLDSPPYKD